MKTKNKKNNKQTANAHPTASPIIRILLKLPVFKKYRQYDYSNTTFRQIYTKACSELFGYSFWYIRNYKNIRHYGLHRIKNYNDLNLSSLDTAELLSIAKHEGHRIEKAHYAGYMNTTKAAVYQRAKDNIATVIAILKERGEFNERPDTAWLQMIHDSFNNTKELTKNAINSPPTFNQEKLREYADFARQRRSSRTWAENKFSKTKLNEIAKSLIECAKWSPCSGNRQPWYFRSIIDQEEKDLLRGIKEEHCIKAPLVIFIGINRKSYGAIGSQEHGIYVDGAAAAMQMIMAAHQANLGSCWNHFCMDFVYSRPKNLPIFKNFYKKMEIPNEIEPIALLAFGIPAFISPPPERPPFEVLCPKRKTGHH